MIRRNKIKIKVNGKFLLVESNYLLSKLLIKKKIPLSKVAKEINNRIINKTNLKKIKLYNGDIIEIVHFIGGGWSWKTI